MELYYDILFKAHLDAIKQIHNCEEVGSIVEAQYYQALLRIQTILKDDTLTDRECFLKIEEIVSVFEDLGSHCGNRHDFG